ncbi:unnamed protein product [Bursaphelenchus okinawaensis]|uniref:Uncharacterized protein n=1 Tax=Bursaphelenchus okinawaensis TaxID=465554 RepID=A0A811K1S1_9BILA|nr:unnamed protein product [Bursaphelenchus okinawaensis]CAG9089162.1 unnamed protein product [Bursaphelenchus okinawaensis]
MLLCVDQYITSRAAVRSHSMVIRMLLKICLYLIFICIGVVGSILHTIRLASTSRAFLVIPLQGGLTFGAFLGYIILRKTLLSTYKRIRFACLSKQFQVLLAVRDGSLITKKLLKFCLNLIFIGIGVVGSILHTIRLANTIRIFLVIPLQAVVTFGAFLGYFFLRKTLLLTYETSLSKQYQVMINYGIICKEFRPKRVPPGSGEGMYKSKS